MTITFPRDIPEIGGFQPFRAIQFKPVVMQTHRVSRGAQPQAAGLGSDLWWAQMTSMQLEYEQALELETWLQTLNGALRTFRLWHPLRRYPKAYPNGFAGMTRAGGGSFDGTCNLNTISSPRDEIQLTTLPASFQFNIADMVSIAFGSSRTLHRVTEAAAANGSGVANLFIAPTIPLGAATSVSVTLVKAWCLATVDPGSIQGPYQAGQAATVSFNATQTF